MQQEEWMGRHVAFLKKGDSFKPTQLRWKALKAIDAGGADGVAMTAVHKALASLHPPGWLINLTIDRLMADGHVHRGQVQTGGRPRVQMWSFRHAPEVVRSDMAYTGVWAAHDFSRLRWDGKCRENIVIEVLRALSGRMLSVRQIEAAAGQLYIDANVAMVSTLYRGKPINPVTPGKILTPGKVREILNGMARQHEIVCNEHGDEFGYWRNR
jgi:hypothetical protein